MFHNVLYLFAYKFLAIGSNVLKYMILINSEFYTLPRKISWSCTVLNL